MSVTDEITRLQTAKADLKTAIEGKGVTVSSSTTLDGYADLVNSIETGDDWVYVNCNTLSDTTNPGAKAGSRFYAQFTNSSNLIVEFVPPYETSVNPTPTWTSNKLISTELQPSTDYLIRYRIKPGVNMTVGDVGTLTITNSSGTVTYTFKLVKTFSDTAVLNTQSVDDGADIEKLNVSGGVDNDNWYGVYVNNSQPISFWFVKETSEAWAMPNPYPTYINHTDGLYFLYRGEKYYATAITDRVNALLSKNGSPVNVNMGTLARARIFKQNGNYYVYFETD